MAQVRGSVLKIQGSGVLHNGDGLCFLNKKGVFEGFRVNRVEDALVYPFEKLNISSGTLLYRNYDRLFEQALQKKARNAVFLSICGSMKFRTGLH